MLNMFHRWNFFSWITPRFSVPINQFYSFKDDAIEEAAEAIQDLSKFNEPLNSKKVVEKQVKGNLKTFLEDVDIQRQVKLTLVYHFYNVFGKKLNSNFFHFLHQSAWNQILTLLW